MACRLVSAKPLSEPILSEIQTFSLKKMNKKGRLEMAVILFRPHFVKLIVLQLY